jgi:hypothetical protein
MEADAMMQPAERIAAALALGERAISDFVRNFGVTREIAILRLRQAGRAGRRYSKCMDDEVR